MYFRILFGAILLVDVWLYFHNGWIALNSSSPGSISPIMASSGFIPGPATACTFTSPHWAFWLSASWSALPIALARPCFSWASPTCSFWTQARYLNHFYFVALVSFLMIFVPAHRKFSVDAFLRPQHRLRIRPRLEPVGSARANGSRVLLSAASPSSTATGSKAGRFACGCRSELNLPVLWSFRDQVWLALVFSYSGLLIDLLAVPLLLWRRTRPYMFAALALFHLTNSNLFDIGIFPWFATAMTALYFDPDWPRRLIALARPGC